MKTNGRFVTVRTTVETEEQARTLARQVVDARLAACAQFMPISSVYRWKGRVESASERLILMKTRESLATELMAFVRQHHAYEVPEIVVTPIRDGLEAYLRWIEEETAVPDAGE